MSRFKIMKVMYDILTGELKVSNLKARSKIVLKTSTSLLSSNKKSTKYRTKTKGKTWLN